MIKFVQFYSISFQIELPLDYRDLGGGNMNFLDNRYSQLRNFIETQYINQNSWEKVKSLDFMGMEKQMSLKLFSSLVALSSDELTEEVWDKFVEYMQNRDKKHNIVKLGRNTFNDATIPNDKYTAWQLYKSKLIKQGWSDDTIKSIEKTSFEILKNLSMDTTEDGATKGLVIGNVQSGKTANMAGLMAMAADNGFNYFIVLSGVVENLRQQTATRLYNDMNSSGIGNLHWHQVEKPSLRSKLPEHDISKFNLGSNAKDRYFTVCLKNSSRLNALIKWLLSDPNKAKQLKVLVIDDEADQASVNTKKIEDEDRTKINKHITKLVNSDSVKGMNYIAYTATPYANVLNETDEESLYPKDFIVLLETSEDYIGPKQFFGTEEPESTPQIDVIRDIPDGDVDLVRKVQDLSTVGDLPNSLIDSLHWFMLSVAAMRALDYHKPISMLIHTSFKINHHTNIAKKVEHYLLSMRDNFEVVKEGLREMYENESLDFKRSHFLDGMKNYSSKENVPDYPKWEEVERYLDRIIRLPESEFVSHIPIGEEGQPAYHKGFHLVIDNSRAKADDQIVRLVYPKTTSVSGTAPAFIVIGGNTLSRGLTLEGLTTSYFLRTTNQADTLMQMARWFGYRKGYEIFPRVWMEQLALERFQFLSQMNEELKDEIAEYANSGLTPTDYAPRIKNSSDYKLIRITSSNKMQSAEPKEYDFAGFNSQTVYFENDSKKILSNLKITEAFLNDLGEPEIKNSHMIWQDISTENIKNFLINYEVCEKDIKMSNLPALLEWAEKNSEDLSNWSVVLSSKGRIEETKGLDNGWNIHGYSPKSSVRTKLTKRSTESIANIGALRSPGDLVADIEEELTVEEKGKAKPSEIRAIREKYGYGKVPQIVIYKIDKGQLSNEDVEKFESKPARSPLNFPEDIIGINVMIPGLSKGGQLATYISAKINTNNNFEQDEFYEEELESSEN